MGDIMANTLQTTGVTMTVEVSAYDFSLFTAKLAHLNKNLTKWGLGAAKVLSREYRVHDKGDLTGFPDDQGVAVYRWHMLVEVPVATTKITGHTLVGVIEDLGKGQRMLTAIVGDRDSLPKPPEELPRDDQGHETLEQQQAYASWYTETYLPAYTAAYGANVAKLETLRGAPQVCVHCQTTRRRKQVLIFEKTDGALVQVGKDCAKEYFGTDLQQALQGTWDLQERCGGGAPRFSPDTFRQDFAIALFLISKFGYVSQKVEESYREQAQFVPTTVPTHVKTSTKYLVEEVHRFTTCGSHRALTPADYLLASSEDEAAIRQREQELHAAWTAAEVDPHDSNPEAVQALRIAQGAYSGFVDVWTAFTEIRKAGGPQGTDHYGYMFLRDMHANPGAYEEARVDAMNFWASLIPALDDPFTANVKAVAMAEANKSGAMTAMVVLKWLEATKGVEKADYFRPAHRTMFPAMPEARYLAAKGEMVDVVLTITERRSGSTCDGAPWYLVKGRTDENVEASMFCKNGIYDSVKEGVKVHLRAKVKGQEVFKGRCTTTLFYTKVID